MAKNIKIVPNPSTGRPYILFENSTGDTIALTVESDGTLVFSGATNEDQLVVFDTIDEELRIKSNLQLKGDLSQKGIGSITSSGYWKGNSKDLKGDKGLKGQKGIDGNKGLLGDASDKGSVGSSGDLGPLASKGDKGIKGERGIDGNKGTEGEYGEKGPLGPQGPVNDKGQKGEKGEKGIKGLIGPIGPIGNKGPKGFNDGPQGDKGNKGTDQSDTNAEKGEKGIIGDEGPASDERLKDNIKTLKGNLSRIQKIRGVQFTWKGEIKHSKLYRGKDIGFIAQEMDEVVPEVVMTRDDGYLTLEYGKLVAIGIGAIQEQDTRIKELKQRINLLKAKILNG